MSLYSTILSTEDIEVDSLGRTPLIQSVSSFPATSSSSSPSSSHTRRSITATKQTASKNTETTSSREHHAYERELIDQEIHHHRPLGMSHLKNGRVIIPSARGMIVSVFLHGKGGLSGVVESPSFHGLSPQFIKFGHSRDGSSTVWVQRSGTRGVTVQWCVKERGQWTCHPCWKGIVDVDHMILSRGGRFGVLFLSGEMGSPMLDLPCHSDARLLLFPPAEQASQGQSPIVTDIKLQGTSHILWCTSSVQEENKIICLETIPSEQSIDSIHGVLSIRHHLIVDCSLTVGDVDDESGEWDIDVKMAQKVPLQVQSDWMKGREVVHVAMSQDESIISVLMRSVGGHESPIESWRLHVWNPSFNTEGFGDMDICYHSIGSMDLSAWCKYPVDGIDNVAWEETGLFCTLGTDEGDVILLDRACQPIRWISSSGIRYPALKTEHVVGHHPRIRSMVFAPSSEAVSGEDDCETTDVNGSVCLYVLLERGPLLAVNMAFPSHVVPLSLTKFWLNGKGFHESLTFALSIPQTRGRDQLIFYLMDYACGSPDAILASSLDTDDFIHLLCTMKSCPDRLSYAMKFGAFLLERQEIERCVRLAISADCEDLVSMVYCVVAAQVDRKYHALALLLKPHLPIKTRDSLTTLESCLHDVPQRVRTYFGDVLEDARVNGLDDKEWEESMDWANDLAVALHSTAAEMNGSYQDARKWVAACEGHEKWIEDIDFMSKNIAEDELP